MTISDEQLNAYVDGELGAEDTARVAAAIAADHDLARHVAEISALKVALPQIIPGTPDINLARKNKGESLGFATPSFRIAAAAAALMAIIVTGSVSYTMFHDSDLFENAVAVHDIWTKRNTADGHYVRSEDLGVFAALNLSSAGLMLADRADLMLDGYQAVRLSFIGSRGCKVSLFAIDGIPNLSSNHENNRNLRSQSWKTEVHTYLLLGYGMDEARFAILAKALSQFSETYDPFNLHVEQRLASSRAESAPCNA